MKLTAILLLAAALQVSAKGFGQAITLDLKNASLEKVITEIEKQSGYSFVYGKEQLAQAKTIDLTVRNEKLESVLDLIFKDQPLTYTISGKYIALRQKIATSENVKAEAPPPIDVHGRVVNDRGQPVAGATVSVKGSSLRTSTDDNGFFTLKGVDENATLVISAVNIEELTIKVNGKTDLATLSVKTKVTTGEGVVVNTGYQLLKPNEVIGSVEVISREQLDQRVAGNIIDKLEGITNGLVFNKTRAGDNMLRVRGESTIFAYAEPLIVVDNFPYEGDINNINPNDVENVTILKDAAATSIYGARGGNGVIVITTKKGKLNQPLRVSVTANTTITDKPDLFYRPQIGVNDWIDLETLLFNKGYYNANLSNINLPAVSPIVEILNKRKLGQITAADSVAQIDALRNLDYRNDFSKYIYQKAIRQQYHLGMNGGSSRFSYSFSAGYDKTRESLIGNESSRITLNNQTAYNPIKNLEIRVGISYVENTNINNGINPQGNIYPYTTLYDANGNELSVARHRALFEDTIASHSFLDWKYYPLQEIKYRNNRTTNYDTRLFASIKYNIYKGLVLDFSYGYQRSLVRKKNLTYQESYEIRNNINRFAILTNGNFIASNYPSGGALEISNADLVSNNGRVNLIYNHKWKEHRIDILTGFEAREIKKEESGYNFIGYNDDNGSFAMPVDTTYRIYLGNGNFSTSKLGILPPIYKGAISRFRSFYGNVAYTFKDRYSIYASARSDGSNYFGVKTNNKTVPLWSSGLKWDISKEKFYTYSQIPSLSLRATYGYSGNLASDVVALTTFRYSPSPSSLTGAPYASITNTPNPELRWEKSSQFNISLDFESKSTRLVGSLGYFVKHGKDLIGNAPFDPTTGITSLKGNFSGLVTKGWDIQFRTINIANPFTWNTLFNFNYASERVTKYDITATAAAYLNASGTIVPQVGKPLYRLYSYRWAGLDPANGDPRIYIADTINKTYNSNTTNTIKENDLVYSGKSLPPIVGSLLNTFSWKGISLSFNITYKFGYYFRRATTSYTELIQGWQFGLNDYALRWQKPGDETKTNVPSFIYPQPAGSLIRETFYRNADILVEKGDHVRLQFINLNYTVNNTLLKKMKLRYLQFYFYANNIGILWRANKKGIDPDYQTAAYSPARTYSFGIKTEL